MENEIWLPIPGFDGRYMAGSHGKIKSVYSVTKTGKRRELNTVLKEAINARGYYIVKLSGKTYKVHRLIAVVFHENQCNKPQVNHKDLNKLNNAKDNLEWVTAKENTNHAQWNGRVSVAKPSISIGQYPKRYKKIANTNTGQVYNSARELVPILGMTVKSITRRLAGERKCDIPYAYVTGLYHFEYL